MKGETWKGWREVHELSGKSDNELLWKGGKMKPNMRKNKVLTEIEV